VPATTIPREARIRALLDWLDGHGTRLARCRVVAVPGQGAGMVATEDMQEDDEILFVPRELWLTVKTRHTPYGRVLRHVEKSASFLPGGMSRLALLLALERERPDSYFAPYLAELPSPSIPDGLPEEDLAELQSAEAAAWVVEQRDEAAREHALLAETLPARFPDLFPEGLFGLDTWRWAYGHSLQRSFSVDIDGEEVWVQVPGMGFCNHDAQAHNTYYAEEDGWLFEAGRPWRAGEAITIDYGSDKSSLDFFLYYGFVPPANPNDRVRIRLALDPADPDHGAKRAALDESGLRDECLLGADGEVPTSFLDAATLCGLDSAAFHDDDWDWEDPRHERRTLDALAAALRDRLAALPTSVAEDLALLDDPARQGFDRAMVAYRLAFKEVLVSAAESIERRSEDLRVGAREPNEVVPDPEEDGVYELAVFEIPWPPRG
jgi:hypothetical protein